MKIYLRDRNPEMGKAWKLFWKNDPDVEISCGDIFAGEITDAIISPSNSLGFLDGGIDAIYSMRWPKLQGDLQEYLAKNHYGELPVGCAVIIPITHGNEHLTLPGSWKRKGEEDFKFLISSPTMRVPQNVSGSVNAYLAFRAALIAVLEHNKTSENKINSVLCPGLGTAIGKLDPKIAAMQMYTAYEFILKKPFDIGTDLSNAWHMHEQLRRGVI